MKKFNLIAPYLALFLWTFWVHGWLLFNRGLYFDGWIYFNFLEQKDWIALKNQFTALGLPVLANLHWALHTAPDLIFAYKLITFLSLFLASISFYKLVLWSKLFNLKESVCVSILFISVPCCQFWVETGSFQYPLGICLFLAAAVLAVLNSQKKNNLFLYIISAAVFFFSFAVNSLLVLFFVFLCYWAWLLLQNEKGWKDKPLLKRIPKTIVIFASVPVLYWVCKKMFFKSYAMYAGYNKISLNPAIMLNSTFNFFKNSLYEQLLAGFVVFWQNTVIFGFTLLLAVLIAYFFLKPQKTVWDRQSLKALGLFLCLLFFGAIFPYAVVGKYPLATGWNTRHALLFMFPVTMLAGITVFLIRSYMLRFLIFVSILTLFSVVQVQSYLDWNERWVKDQGIILNLKELKDVPQFDTAIIDDQWKFENTDYNFYEWSAFFYYGLGKQAFLGVNSQAEIGAAWGFIEGLEPQWKKNYFLDEYKGPKQIIHMLITPRERKTGLKVAIETIGMLLFGSRDELNNYLKNSVQIEFLNPAS